MIDKIPPLTELHRHLDGNIRPRPFSSWDVSTTSDCQPMNWRPCAHTCDRRERSRVWWPSQETGLGRGRAGRLRCLPPVAYENVEDLLRAGIDYAELRFSPAYMAMTHKLHPQGVVGHHRRRGRRQP